MFPALTQSNCCLGITFRNLPGKIVLYSIYVIMYVHGNQLTQTTDDEDDGRHTLNLSYYQSKTALSYSFFDDCFFYGRLFKYLLFKKTRFHGQ